MLPFERVEAAALAIDKLLDDVFGKCELPPQVQTRPITPVSGYSSGDGNIYGAQTRLGLQEYRTIISQLDTHIQTNSLRIACLQSALVQAQLLQDQLELRQGGLVFSCDQLLRSSRSPRTQLPNEIICKIFSYAFPVTGMSAVKALHSNPWKEVLLRTTLIDVRCDDVLNSERINAWKAETIANADPAGLSLVMQYDTNDNTGEEIIEALSPHLGRARNLELIRDGHDSCGPLQTAVKVSGERLRLENLTMKVKHARCIASCIAPTLLHLYLEDVSVFPTNHTHDLLCILQATPNLRTFSLACQSLTFIPASTQPIPLPNLHRLKFRSSLLTMTFLVKFLSEALDSPSVREFHAEFSQLPWMFEAQDEHSPLPPLEEELVETIDKKYPLLTHLSLCENGQDRMTKSPTAKVVEADILHFLNTSTKGSEPLLRNLSSISVDASLSHYLLEDLARNRAKNPRTKRIWSLELHAANSEMLEERFRENIKLYYPNVTFVGGYFVKRPRSETPPCILGMPVPLARGRSRSRSRSRTPSPRSPGR